MTLNSVKECAVAIRDRYHNGSKEEKGKILDEFVKITGYHRKAATRLLLKMPKAPGVHRGRPSQFKALVTPLVISGKLPTSA
jgi:hypothetical protein